MNPRTMKPLENQIGTEQIDSDFKNDLAKLVAKRVLYKALLPTPIGNAMIFLRGLRYVGRAVKNLFDCHLNVEVLDGTSVAACLLQKNYKTAGTIMFLLSVSSLLEDYTRARTKAALTDSLAIKTEQVWVVDGDVERLMPSSRQQSATVMIPFFCF